MIDYANILNGESGLSVRAKITSMFRDLISGNEGVNELWKRIVTITSALNLESQEREDMYITLKAQILSAFDYTDRQVTNLKVYVDALESGMGGFIPSTSYNPEVSADKAYTFIAVGAGTYTYFLDSDGDPITITDDNALTIFYKGANSTYWQTKSVTSILVKEALDGGSAAALNTSIQIRRDTEANWESANPVLKQGEIALVSRKSSPPYRYTNLKIGDGSSTFVELPYFIGTFDCLGVYKQGNVIPTEGYYLVLNANKDLIAVVESNGESISKVDGHPKEGVVYRTPKNLYVYNGIKIVPIGYNTWIINGGKANTRNFYKVIDAGKAKLSSDELFIQIINAGGAKADATVAE